MWFLKQHLQVLKGSAKPGHDWLLDSPVSLKCIYELALLKQKEQPYLSLQSVCKMLVATARSAGLVVVP
ncbi:hypothetical protein HMI54_002143 [Coelomomyces lativittatus]|nr:hypothetical protein HMI54_002143 [Coelomomyces lativittatus]